MAENFLAGSQAIEAEIAQLQRMIETKRNQLEGQGGMIEEKELVRGAVQEMLTEEAGSGIQAAPVARPTTMASSQTSATGGASYLDRLDEESTAKLNTYIAEIGQRGIVKTLNKVMAEEPFIIDAFHDALIDRLYDELKAQGLIK